MIREEQRESYISYKLRTHHAILYPRLRGVYCTHRYPVHSLFYTPEVYIGIVFIVCFIEIIT